MNRNMQRSASDCNRAGGRSDTTNSKVLAEFNPVRASFARRDRAGESFNANLDENGRHDNLLDSASSLEAQVNRRLARTSKAAPGVESNLQICDDPLPSHVSVPRRRFQTSGGVGFSATSSLIPTESFRGFTEYQKTADKPLCAIRMIRSDNLQNPLKPTSGTGRLRARMVPGWTTSHEGTDHEAFPSLLSARGMNSRRSREGVGSSASHRTRTIAGGVRF